MQHVGSAGDERVGRAYQPGCWPWSPSRHSRAAVPTDSLSTVPIPSGLRLAQRRALLDSTHMSSSSGPTPQAKGTNLIPAVKFLRAHKDRALARLPAELHVYLEKRVLPGSWYPEEDFMAMMRALVAMVGTDERAAWEMFGVQAADAHASGPYEGVLRLGPRRFLGSLDAFWRLQHSTGSWQVSFGQEKNAADARLTDFPAGMPEYGQLVVGYLRRILILAGAEQAACLLVRCDAQSGHWQLSWED